MVFLKSQHGSISDRAYYNVHVHVEKNVGQVQFKEQQILPTLNLIDSGFYIILHLLKH